MTSHRKIFLLTLLVWVTVALSLPHRTYAQKASAKVSAHQRQANARFVALWSDPSGDTYEHKEMTSLQAQKALNSGADVNARDRDGKTALITAAEDGNPALVHILLAHRADLEAQDHQGRTALFWAMTGYPVFVGNRLGLALILSPQQEAVALAHRLNSIRLLLGKGAKVNTQDHQGETPLQVAAGMPMEGGFSGEVTVLNQHTAIQFHLAIINLLLSHDANVNAKNRSGMDALITLAEIGMADTVRLLLTHGADVNSRDANGTTALMYAAIEGHVGAIQLLLAHGANVNARDRDGETALGMATRLSKAKAVAVLQAAGAK